MSVQKFFAIFLLLFFAAFQATTVCSRSLESFNFRIIPREVQSIVARLCDSSSLEAARKAHDLLQKNGLDALVAQAHSHADKNLDDMSRIKKTQWLKQTLMYAIVARNHAAANAAQGSVKGEMDTLIFQTLEKMCECISNLDKIIYLEGGQVNTGAYEALLQKLHAVDRQARHSGI